ncbi:DEAD/DEAH box helicase family protein, partial [Candidatus Gracilibacteria bacterium]|nr:DEAD/DEAH box helicase family protein [Candidatus Gracilibacteria bacterium]
MGTAILEYPVLLALEVNPRMEAGKAVTDKAPVFSQRISQARRSPVAGSCTLEEALTWSLAEKAKVDLPLIADLAGVTPDEAAHGLAGRIYRELDAATERWVLADELLSGNVREKLALARRLATVHPAFAAHIPALEAVQPALLTRAEIKVNLGVTWLPVAIIAHFIGTLVPDFRSYDGTVEFHAVMNAWKITAPRQARGSYAATQAWATDRRTFFDIFDALIHQRELVVMDEIEEEDGKIIRRMNQPATAAANAVADRIKEAFQNWLWADESRAQDLERRYNEQFNCFVERRYNGDHLAITGLNTTGLRTGDADPHQKDVIWRILAQQATYIAHPVGAGKTLTMLGGISEALRRGMARKVLVCVPNSIVQQWAADVLRFFPGLRVLAMTAKDFEKSRRRQFLAHIATGQWDIVVVGTTTFTRLPLPVAVRKQFYMEEISSLRQYLYEVYNTDMRSDKEKKRDRALKRIESRAQALEAKLKALDATVTREDEQVLNLVELGFDMLVVDEFHLYKNLEFSTTKTRVAGLPSGGSERAFDMWQKIQYFMRNGHKVVVASGTPIANTLCEAYVNMKYLQWNLMHELGIAHFDAWAAQFAEPTLSFELRPDASGFRTVLRMSKFINLPELHQLTRQVMDVKLEAELKLPRPQIITGRPVPVVIDASEQLVEYIRDLGNRADAISNGQVDPEEDNMLKITSDGRLAALDMRLVGGTRDAGNKIDRLVENVLARYHESAPWSGTQIVFCDLATPKGNAAGFFRISPHSGEPCAHPAVGWCMASIAWRSLVYHAISCDTISTSTVPVNVISVTDAEDAVETAALLTRLNAGDADEGTEESTDEVGAEASNRNFVYHEIKQRLIAAGIPTEEVAFIQDAKTPAERESLFAKVRKGDIRVFLGSTMRMGVGVNVQERCYAVHHLTTPWRPCDVKQADGRVWRPGNLFPEVWIFRYIAAPSFDGFSWQGIETKGRFEDAYLRGDPTVREMSDIDEQIISAGELKALASGDGRIVQKVRLEHELGRLKQQRSTWETGRTQARLSALHAEQDAQKVRRRIERLRHYLSLRTDDTAISLFGSMIDRTNPAQARANGKTIRDALVTWGETVSSADLQRDGRVIASCGSYRGLPLSVVIDLDGNGKKKLPYLILADEIDGKVLKIVDVIINIGDSSAVLPKLEAAATSIEARIASVEQEAARFEAEAARFRSSLAATWEMRAPIRSGPWACAI